MYIDVIHNPHEILRKTRIFMIRTLFCFQENYKIVRERNPLMTEILIALSNVLHTLATIVFVGHYLLLSLLYIPALSNTENGGAVLSDISKRSRLWLYIAFGIFAITGVFLTMIDPNYMGLGKFKNLWSGLMLAKHILILAIIVFGFWFNVILCVGPKMLSTSNSTSPILRFRTYSNLIAICGVLVLLLTAFAQIK